MLNKKNKIILFIFVIVVFSFAFAYKFYNEREINFKEEYNLPGNVYLDSAYASVLLHENSEVKHSINKINSIKEKKKFDKEIRENRN
mgnify:CR=1 FL=1